MAISDRLTKLATDIISAYTSIENKGGTIPSDKNTNNLSTAIDSIEVIEPATNEGENLTLTNTKAMPIDNMVVKGKTEQFTTTGKQLFDASKIYSSNIIVEDNGKIIKMAIATSTNPSGYTSTSKTLSQLCPELQVGDTAYLFFTRNLGTAQNNFIYLVLYGNIWRNGTSNIITQTMLDSEVILYANRYNAGETTQCIMTDFRIVKNLTDEWELYTARSLS